MFRNILSPILAGAAAAGLAAGPALAEPTNYDPEPHWLTLGGEVVSVSKDSFQFDYGQRQVTIEMDEWGWFNEREQLRPGEYVVVAGRPDEDFFKNGNFEAEAVYARERNTFYARPAHDQDVAEDESQSANEPGAFTYYPGAYNIPRTAPEGAFVTVSGKVTGINGRNVILDTGQNKVTIDTSALHYNPVDEVGRPQLREGDYIRATGDVSGELFSAKKLSAESITSLRNDSATSS